MRIITIKPAHYTVGVLVATALFVDCGGGRIIAQPFGRDRAEPCARDSTIGAVSSIVAVD